jgi:hypothetical protein
MKSSVVYTFYADYADIFLVVITVQIICVFSLLFRQDMNR